VLRWAASPIGAFKINWDAALNQTKKLMGVGITVRDYKGKVIVTMCSSMSFISDPTMAEAYVAPEGYGPL
jgi:hypothetical protein